MSREHGLGSRCRRNHRKEFCRCDLSVIRSEVEALGLTATSTMTAATHCRKTLVIEEQIADDTLAKQRWIDRQYDLEDAEDDSAGEPIVATAAIIARSVSKGAPMRGGDRCLGTE